MTAPSPTELLLRGYGVDDVCVMTGTSYVGIMRAIEQSSHRVELIPHHRIALRRFSEANGGRAA